MKNITLYGDKKPLSESERMALNEVMNILHNSGFKVSVTNFHFGSNPVEPVLKNSQPKIA